MRRQGLLDSVWRCEYSHTHVLHVYGPNKYTVLCRSFGNRIAVRSISASLDMLFKQDGFKWLIQSHRLMAYCQDIPALYDWSDSDLRDSSLIRRMKGLDKLIEHCVPFQVFPEHRCRVTWLCRELYTHIHLNTAVLQLHWTVGGQGAVVLGTQH